MQNILIAWLVVINLFAFALFCIDKRRAIQNRWRIKESTLFLVSLAGGALGSLVAMNIFRHKTKTAKFVVGIPFLFLLNVACIIALFGWVL